MARTNQSDDPPNGVSAAPERAGQFLGQIVGFDGFRFNPVSLVRAVGFFHSLGGAKSLAALRASSQDSARHEQVLLVARLLYEPEEPNDHLPRLDLGQPDIGEPQDATFFPRFPLHLVEDLPLLLIGGYLAGGEAQPPSAYLDWCTENGQLRADPLLPGPRPLTAVDAFLASKEWQQVDPGDFHAGMLRLQVLRALPQQFQPNESEERALLGSTDATPCWLSLLEEEALLNLVWNPDLAAYRMG